jgi:hypothetical protein
MVMDSFNLNKQEQMPNLPNLYEVGDLPTTRVERPLIVPDRGYELASQQDIDNANQTPAVQNLQPAPSSVPTSTVIRQPIMATERFKRLEVSDGDVIESAWVSNVKKTLEMTKNQPSRRDDEIKEIRKIYQEKRKVA